MASQILAWGKCEVKATPIANSGASVQAAVTFPIPVEGSTQLTTTQGDKQEAKIEGGQVVAVRFNANTYELSFDIRLHSSQTSLPLDGTDGVIPGEFTVQIKPLENTAAPGVTIARASGNVQIGYTSENGTIATYTFSSLLPESGNQVTVGVISDSSTQSGN